jgi:hypothetical protein
MGMSRADLAKRPLSGRGRAHGLRGGRPVCLGETHLDAIPRVLESAGVMFVEGNGHLAGGEAEEGTDVK